MERLGGKERSKYENFVGGEHSSVTVVIENRLPPQYRTGAGDCASAQNIYPAALLLSDRVQED
jgi:hypothetical protein